MLFSQRTWDLKVKTTIRILNLLTKDVEFDNQWVYN